MKAMKRSTAKTLLALVLAVVLTLALCAPALAAKTVLSKQSLTANGQPVDSLTYDLLRTDTAYQRGSDGGWGVGQPTQ